MVAVACAAAGWPVFRDAAAALPDPPAAGLWTVAWPTSEGARSERSQEVAIRAHCSSRGSCSQPLSAGRQREVSTSSTSRPESAASSSSSPTRSWPMRSESASRRTSRTPTPPARRVASGWSRTWASSSVSSRRISGDGSQGGVGPSGLADGLQLRDGCGGGKVADDHAAAQHEGDVGGQLHMFGIQRHQQPAGQQPIQR